MATDETTSLVVLALETEQRELRMDSHATEYHASASTEPTISAQSAFDGTGELVAVPQSAWIPDPAYAPPYVEVLDEVDPSKPPVRVARPARALNWHAYAFSQPERVELVTDRHAVRRMTGVRPRDLRVTDPTLGYPPSIMIREHSLVVNLEHVKAIITADLILVQDTRHELLPPFVRKLEARLVRRLREQAVAAPAADTAARDAAVPLEAAQPAEGHAESTAAPSAVRRRPHLPVPSARALGGLPSVKMPFHLPQPHAGAEEREATLGREHRPPTARAPRPAGLALPQHAVDDTLPAEVCALEVCLQEVCDKLCIDVDALVRAVVPIFDSLTSGVVKDTLEAARVQKTALTRTSARIGSVRAVLEDLVDSERALGEMCLARKREGGSAFHEPPNPAPAEADQQADRLAVEEMEHLLEAYFEQIDGAAKKLAELHDYVGNTEDFVAIELDTHRNQLIQLDLMMTIGTLCLTAASLIGSIFGMNVQFWAPDYRDLGSEGIPGPSTFVAIAVGSIGGAAAVFVALITYCRQKKLLIL